MDLELCSFLEATVRDSELSPSDFVSAPYSASPLAEMTGRLLPNIGHRILLVFGNGTSRDMYVSTLNLWHVFLFFN